MANSVVWIDIPALDLDRAIEFYGAVLGVELARMDTPELKLGFLPGERGDVSGCICLADEIKPSDQGPLIYLNCDGRLDEASAAVEPAGGKVLQPPHPIGPHGYRAVILDSEGNRIALHSR
ncbi:MAG: VOC family protein [Fimbriimonas sp.]|nr:VOC family protein [Fimbriimonas sp.]